MAQVKIFGLKRNLSLCRKEISDIIHSALVGELGLPPDKKFQRFVPMEQEDFLFPADRSAKYTIIEISMFEGRSQKAIKGLLKRIMADMESRLGMHPNDTEITVFQSAKHGWGIRGKTGDESALNYKVDV